jgi:hypothetical protein
MQRNACSPNFDRDEELLVGYFLVTVERAHYSQNSWARQFFAHNLTSGPHNLVISNTQHDSSFLGLKRAVVTEYQEPDVQRVTVTRDNASRTSDAYGATGLPSLISSSRKLSTGLIIGSVIGGLVALVLATLLSFIFARHYFRQRYAPPRFSAVPLNDSEDSLHPNGRSLALSHQSQQMEEVDMPPPNYRGVFPSEHGGSVIHIVEPNLPNEAEIPDRPPLNPDSTNEKSTADRQPLNDRSTRPVATPSKREQISRRAGSVEASNVILPPRRFKRRKG